MDWTHNDAADVLGDDEAATTTTTTTTKLMHNYNSKQEAVRPHVLNQTKPIKRNIVDEAPLLHANTQNNNINSVESGELGGAAVALQNEGVPGKCVQSPVATLMSKFDTEQSGKLDARQWLAFCRENNEQISEREAMDMFQQIDRNHDRQVSIDRIDQQIGAFLTLANQSAVTPTNSAAMDNENDGNNEDGRNSLQLNAVAPLVNSKIRRRSSDKWSKPEATNLLATPDMAQSRDSSFEDPEKKEEEERLIRKELLEKINRFRHKAKQTDFSLPKVFDAIIDDLMAEIKRRDADRNSIEAKFKREQSIHLTNIKMWEEELEAQNELKHELEKKLLQQTEELRLNRENLENLRHDYNFMQSENFKDESESSQAKRRSDYDKDSARFEYINDELQTRIEELESEISHAKADELIYKHRIETSMEELKKKESEINKLKTERLEHLDKVQNLMIEIRNLSDKNDDLNAALESLTSKRESLSSEKETEGLPFSGDEDLISVDQISDDEEDEDNANTSRIHELEVFDDNRESSTPTFLNQSQSLSISVSKDDQNTSQHSEQFNIIPQKKEAAHSAVQFEAKSSTPVQTRVMHTHVSAATQLHRFVKTKETCMSVDVRDEPSIVPEVARRAIKSPPPRFVDQFFDTNPFDEVEYEEYLLTDSSPTSCATHKSEHEALDNDDAKHTFKIILIGNASVGKTSFMMRFCQNSFTQLSSATVGVDFFTRTVEIDGKFYSIQLWDTAGQERYRSLITMYFRKADGIILMYDCSDPTSFESVEEWIGLIQLHSDISDIPIILLGNKIDLRAERVLSGKEIYPDFVSKRRGHDLSQTFKMMFSECSVKNCINIESTIIELTKVMIQRADKENEMESINIKNSDKSLKKRLRCYTQEHMVIFDTLIKPYGTAKWNASLIKATMQRIETFIENEIFRMNDQLSQTDDAHTQTKEILHEKINYLTKIKEKANRGQIEAQIVELIITYTEVREMDRVGQKAQTANMSVEFRLLKSKLKKLREKLQKIDTKLHETEGERQYNYYLYLMRTYELMKERDLEFNFNIEEEDSIAEEIIPKSMSKFSAFMNNYVNSSRIEVANAISTGSIIRYADDPQKMALTHAFIGRIYKRERDYMKALECYNRCLELRKETLGTESMEVAVTLTRIGTIKGKLRQYDEGREYLALALEIHHKNKEKLELEKPKAVAPVAPKKNDEKDADENETEDDVTEDNMLFKSFSLAKIHFCIGLYYGMGGNWSEMLSEYEKALEYVDEQPEGLESVKSYILVQMAQNYLKLQSTTKVFRYIDELAKLFMAKAGIVESEKTPSFLTLIHDVHFHPHTIKTTLDRLVKEYGLVDAFCNKEYVNVLISYFKLMEKPSCANLARLWLETEELLVDKPNSKSTKNAATPASAASTNKSTKQSAPQQQSKVVKTTKQPGGTGKPPQNALAVRSNPRFANPAGLRRGR